MVFHSRLDSMRKMTIGAWKDDDGKHHPDRTFDGRISRKRNRIRDSRWMTIQSVKEGKTNRKPQPPFTTESMLRAANGRMGWAIGRTNRVATSLYQSGHITYIRTDSTRTSKDARDRIRSLIKTEHGSKLSRAWSARTGCEKGRKQCTGCPRSH